MIDHDLMIRSIREATADVFSTMIGMSVQCTGPANENRAADSGVVAIVGITGDWGGTGVFCCSPGFAAIISACMLGSAADPARASIDEEVLDVVAEVTNMIVGNIKNGLEPVTGPLAISVPTVIHGRNFRFRNGTGLRGATLCFEAERERFEVRTSLAPADQQSVVRARIPVLGLAQTEC